MKCKECGSKTKADIAFKASYLDIFGMLVFVCLAVLPVLWVIYLLSSAAIGFFIDIFFEVRSQYSGLERWIIIDHVLSLALSFLSYLWLGAKYGYKFLGFLGYFINYRLKIGYWCPDCSSKEILVELPNDRV